MFSLFPPSRNRAKLHSLAIHTSAIMTITLQHLLDEAHEFAAAQHPREGVILAVLAGLHRSGNKDALKRLAALATELSGAIVTPTVTAQAKKRAQPL